MKTKILLIVILLACVDCSEFSKKDHELIENARDEIIKLDQKYNILYQDVMTAYMNGDYRYESAVVYLQALTKELMLVNKALKIDCKQYNENGEPNMFEDKDGSLSPIEIIPNELKIEK